MDTDLFPFKDIDSEFGVLPLNSFDVSKWGQFVDTISTQSIIFGYSVCHWALYGVWKNAELMAYLRQLSS